MRATREPTVGGRLARLITEVSRQRARPLLTGLASVAVGTALLAAPPPSSPSPEVPATRPHKISYR